MKGKAQIRVAGAHSSQLLSIRLVEFAQQLLLQMLPRSLLDRTTLGGYPLLLRLTFAPRSRLHRLRHVSDPGPARADVSLFWFCVRIEGCRALSVGLKNNRNCGVSRHNFIGRRLRLTDENTWNSPGHWACKHTSHIVAD